nr:MAG TPA: Cytosine specific methyltransferase [Caudoviricetes sp.]
MGQYLFGCITPNRIEKRQNGQRFNDGIKFYTLTAQDEHGVLIEGYIRKLTPIECERLQTLPDNYTLAEINGKKIIDNKRYKMLGNGWTVDVIAHILSFIKRKRG